MQLTDPNLIAEVTSQWQGERQQNGRPLVPDDILERMQSVTTEEAWSVLSEHGYEHNFSGDWTILFPDRVLVGRAVTCRWVPLRPELHEIVLRQGELEGRIGFPNSWVIDGRTRRQIPILSPFSCVSRFLVSVHGQGTDRSGACHHSADHP